MRALGRWVARVCWVVAACLMLQAAAAVRPQFPAMTVLLTIVGVWCVVMGAVVGVDAERHPGRD